MEGILVVFPKIESQPVPLESLPNPPPEPVEPLTLKKIPAPELKCLEKEELPEAHPPSPASPNKPEAPPMTSLTEERLESSGIASL